MEYFDGKAYLSQCPQFFKQMAQPAGFGKIFEVGPASAPTRASRRGTRPSSPASTPRSRWIDSHEDVMSCRGTRSSPASRQSRTSTATEIQEAFGVEVVVPTPPFPRIPLAEAKEIIAKRGYVAYRARMTTWTREGERRRRIRQGDPRPRVRVPHRLSVGHPAVLSHAPRRQPGPDEELRPHLQRHRDLDGGPARAPHRAAAHAKPSTRGSTPRSSRSTSTSSATGFPRTADSASA